MKNRSQTNMSNWIAWVLICLILTFGIMVPTEIFFRFAVIGSILVFIIVIWAFRFHFLWMYQMYFLYRNPSNIVITDVSKLEPEFPALLKEQEEHLQLAGFERLGVLKLEYPKGISSVVWCFVGEDNRIYATLLYKYGEVVMTTTSVFPDKALVETGYLKGYRIESPNLRAQFVMDSFDHTYHLHLQQIEDFRREHGEPITITSMATILDSENKQSEHIRLKLQQSYKRSIRIILGMLYIPTAFFIFALLAKETILSNMIAGIWALASVIIVLLFTIKYELSFAVPSRKKK